MIDEDENGEGQGNLASLATEWTREDIRAAAKTVPWGYLTWTHQLVHDLGHYPGGVRWNVDRSKDPKGGLP